MFPLSNRALSRRRVLRGLGASVGLPFLDAMTPVRARSATVPPVRMAFLYVPNGMIMPRWTPLQTGSEFELPPTLEPLADLREDITIISGLQHRNGEEKGDGPGDHARASGSYLTGVRPHKSATSARAGISVDQRAAQALQSLTRLPSLELTCDRGQAAGACDSGYNCSYQATLSWRSDLLPQPAEVDPRAVFDRLFSDGGLTPAQRAARRRHDRSTLDFVLEDVRSLSRHLGAADREKLDEYLSAVRAVERRIDHQASAPPPRTPKGARRPSGRPGSYTDHIRVMGELIRLAFISDATRVVTFLLSREGNGEKFPELGGHDSHHAISHHQNNQEKIEILSRIDRFHVDQLANMLRTFKRTREGDRSLLDSCMIVLGSGLSDGNRHKHHDLPTLLAGGANGGLRTGRHVKAAEPTPMCNLFVSMLHRMGIDDAAFGDSTGPLAELERPM